MQDWVPDPKCDDETLEENNSLKEWYQRLEASSALADNREEAGPPNGFAFSAPLFYESMMEKAGFVNVTVQYRRWPTNNWPAEERYKTIGLLALDYINSILEAHGMRRFTNSGMSREEAMMLAARARKDLHNPKKHAYYEAYVIYFHLKLI